MNSKNIKTPKHLLQRFFILLWRLAVTPATFVVIAMMWCLDLGLGSIGAYLLDPNFAAKMDAYPFNLWLREVAPAIYPNSLWVYILVILTWLMILSLLLCSINWLLNRRKKWRGLGEFFVHSGFLLIFAGFVAGAVWGTRQQGVLVPLNGEKEVAHSGINLKLTKLDLVTNGRGQTLDTVSTLTMLNGKEEIKTGVVRINHPLIAGKTVVYPRGSAQVISKITLASYSYGKARAKRELLPLASGQSDKLANGDQFKLKTILQNGERWGMAIGPGVLLQYTPANNPGKSRQIYLTTVIPGRQQAEIANHVTIQLAGFSYQKFARFDVHRDPGISLVLYGTYILGFGAIWALWGYIKNRPLIIENSTT